MIIVIRDDRKGGKGWCMYKNVFYVRCKKWMKEIGFGLKKDGRISDIIEFRNVLNGDWFVF